MDYQEFKKTSDLAIEKVQKVRFNRIPYLNSRRVVDIEIRHYQDEKVTVSSFGKIDPVKVEESWLEYFKNQEPISVSDFILNKKADESSI